jgi:alkylation response protein AidB-like acyl-CoA dehydrogenase
MSGLGQNFAGQYGQNLMAAGQAAAQGMLGAGSARASGYIGGANALTGALGQYLNYTQNQNLMNRLLPGGGGGGSIGNYPVIPDTGMYQG